MRIRFIRAEICERVVRAWIKKRDEETAGGATSGRLLRPHFATLARVGQTSHLVRGIELHSRPRDRVCVYVTTGTHLQQYDLPIPCLWSEVVGAVAPIAAAAAAAAAVSG